MLTKPIAPIIAKPGETVVPPAPQRTARALRVAVIIVTWNRRQDVTGALRALSRQTFGPDRLDVVVVDNAGTDGTLEHLAATFFPESIVENRASAAHEPRFEPAVSRTPDRANALGLGSLTIVRNQQNFGGCGGFNTGFAYVSTVLDEARSRAGGAPPDYVWLVDDDIDLAPDACEHLVRTAEADPSVGLVGTRTVDLNDRQTTIETTIYFDPETGRMSDEPPPGHRLESSHRAWAAGVGGTKGHRPFTGVREVDVASACSLLARWESVRRVGFWDYRYFIYCDDADWCLRFGKAGYKVVINLDAMVYHTPWHHKLTPVRAYYAQRNLLWVLQKIVAAPRLRPVTARWMASVLRQSFDAAVRRRLFHAEIIRRSVDDVVRAVVGKLDHEGPPFDAIGPALERAGLLRPDAQILVMCNWPDAGQWGAEARAAVASHLAAQGRERDMPAWVEVIRNDMPGAEAPPPPGVTRRIVYSARRRSKLRRQIPLLFGARRAVMVFNQYNDFPLVRGGLNIHIDRRRPAECQVEQDGLVPRLAFLGRWLGTCARSLWHVATLRPYASDTRYG